MSQETAITIYPSIRKLLLLLMAFTIFTIGATIFVAGMVYLGVSGGWSVLVAVTGALLGCVGVAYFGAIAVYLAYRLRVRQPVLVIDADGILHHWGPMPVGLIRWTEIESVASWNGASFLGVMLRDREAFTRRQPRLRRWWLALKRWDVPPVGIEQAILPIDVHTLAGQIKRDYGVKFEGAAPRPVPRMSQEKAITICHNIPKLVLGLIGATIFLAIGVYVAVVREGLGLGVVIIASYVGVPFFGTAAVVAAYELLVRHPRLVFDADGIRDRYNLIRWTEIESVARFTYLGNHFLGVALRDREAFTRQQPRLRRWLLALNPSRLPVVHFAQEFLSMDVNTLAEQLNRDYGVKFDRAAQPRSIVPFKSCHIAYDLTRRQRLVAHLGVWALSLPLVILGGVGAVAIIALSVAVSPWFASLIIVPLWFARRFIAGLLNIIFVRTTHFDLTIEENGLRCETKGGLWTFGVDGNYDGIIRIRRYSKDTWTMLVFNGLVISIPVDAIEQQYIDHIRAKAEL